MKSSALLLELINLYLRNSRTKKELSILLFWVELANLRAPLLHWIIYSYCPTGNCLTMEKFRTHHWTTTVKDTFDNLYNIYCYYEAKRSVLIAFSLFDRPGPILSDRIVSNSRPRFRFAAPVTLPPFIASFSDVSACFWRVCWNSTSTF